MRDIVQRLSYKQKSANDFKWAKEVIDSLESYSYRGWSPDSKNNVPLDSRLDMIWRSYRLYNNQVDEKDFEDDLNPFGFQLGQKKDKIMPYNKAHNKINVLISELLKRPFNFKATFTNLEGAYALLEERKRLVKEYVLAQIMMEGEKSYLSQQEMPQEQLQVKLQEIEQKYASVKNPDQIDEYLKNEYTEPREIKSNKLLEDLCKRLNILDKKKDSFKHGLLSDEEHCWVGLVNGKITLKVLNPLGVFFHKSPEVKYIQDGDFAGYRTRMSVADVLDNYKDLKDKDVKKLEERYQERGGGEREKDYYFPHTDLKIRKNELLSEVGSYGYSFNDDVEVINVAWRSQRKVGFFNYIDENGELQTEIVDEAFKLDKTNPKHISLDWEWVPEVWEGTKIDSDIYVNIRPIEWQEVDPEDPYYQPLPYHGVVYNNMNATQISTMERMRPFQFLYFIVVHKLKKLIADDRGKAIEIDVTRLDPKIGLEETLFYLNELNVYLYNSAQGAENPGASTRSAVGGAIDRSNAQHIINYLNVLNYIDEQIGEVAGVTRAREGKTEPYEAVTNQQQSIMQSSTITELIFHAHQMHWENVLNYMIDIAIKKADEEGGVFQSFGPKLERDVYTIKPGELKNCKLGVFVVDNPRDNEIFRQIQSLAQPLLQTDKARFSQIIKLLKQSFSTEEMIRDIESFENMMDQENARRFQQEQEMKAKELEDARNIEMMKMNHEASIHKMDNETKIQIAQINSFSRQLDQDIDDDGTPDQFEIAQFQEEARQEQEKLNLENKRLTQEKEENDKDRQVKREEMKSKEKIAKSRPKPKTSK